MQMPWVFLHAIKDYYDMPWIVSRHQGVEVTFNLSATLIAQLKCYRQAPESHDRFLTLWSKAPSLLKESEKVWLVKLCKSAQTETMVAHLPRYQLLSAQEAFTSAQLLDLEMLFLLSWCGVYLRRNNAVVMHLIEKQQAYTPEDKKALLETLGLFVNTILDFYKMLYHQGAIALSTTPFYHPILPLLLDMHSAKEANPLTEIPSHSFSLKEDAIAQITKAKQLFKETFEKEPVGFWPAEGAVDRQSVALLESLGIRWIATDEAILYRSLHTEEKAEHYKLYRYHSMYMVFRDHHLSDLIGFEYRYQEAKDAVDDFMKALKKIETNRPNATVSVILDGENAWEFYHNNGFDFLETLYGTVRETAWCHTLTMEHLLEEVEAKPLETLVAGSWINGTFDTWVGNREKTRAWELLFLTKKEYAQYAEQLDENVRSQIGEFFLRAESSDWFWWYGEDHYSAFAREFDILFRNHLIAIYQLMKRVPPHDLLLPITKNKSSSRFWLKPQSDITPLINGKRDSFFEWMGCGVIYEDKLFSTMERQRGPVKTIYYGQDREKLYFAFEGEMMPLCQEASLQITIDPIGVHLKIPFQTETLNKESIAVKIACKEWLELSIEKHTLELDTVFLRFEIEDAQGALQMLPSFGELTINLNDDYRQNWFI